MCVCGVGRSARKDLGTEVSRLLGMVVPYARNAKLFFHCLPAVEVVVNDGVVAPYAPAYHVRVSDVSRHDVVQGRRTSAHSAVAGFVSHTMSTMSLMSHKVANHSLFGFAPKRRASVACLLMHPQGPRVSTFRLHRDKCL